MLELKDIDTFIENRLKRIIHNGSPIKVYPYIPDREKGESVYPCIAFLRLYYRIDFYRARPCCEQFVPKQDEITLSFTPAQAYGGAIQITGPIGWTRKPFATPVNIFYQIIVLAVDIVHRDKLLLWLPQVFPVGYQPNIMGQFPLFTIDTPHNFDERDKPLFRTDFILSVEEVWLERLETYEAPSILEPNLEIDTEE